MMGFFMQYFVYILYSASADKFYIGHTKDLEGRLFRHRNSGSKSTKFVNDWIIVHKEYFPSRSDAIKRELYIKSRKSREFINNLINRAD